MTLHGSKSHRRIDITGSVFGKWTVISFSHYRRTGSSGCPMWNCICHCGTERVVSGTSLRTGHTASCGCIKRETTARRNTSHGRSKTHLYMIWKHVNQRCYNPNAVGYKNYGARGIGVCQRWRGRDGFSNFEKDMGARPSKKHSLDRIDNNKNYSPKNCRWATRKMQSRNTRRTKILTFNGESLCVRDWEVRLGFKRGIIRSRLKKGWTIEQSLTIPSLKGKNTHIKPELLLEDRRLPE